MNLDPAGTALITGSGSGLGEAMARRLAAEGYRVAVCDIDGERANRVHRALDALTPGGMSVKMDVTDPASWDRALDRVESAWGGLQILINNAGVAGAGTGVETSLEDWQWILDVDLMGVVRGCHKLVPLVQQTARHGVAGCHVVNVASFAGLAGMPGISAYGTAKAAVVAFSEQLRAELHGSGVGVTVVCPAFVMTRLTENFRSPNPNTRRWVEQKMAQSGVSADDVAMQTIEAMRAGRFMVLTHSDTRTAWRIKRWFPEFYFRRIVKGQGGGHHASAKEAQA